MNEALMPLPSTLPDIARAPLPEMYRKARGALAACSSIDECKTWADKAAALASYAKQADDDTLHKLATRITARAIRRCGELLKTFEQDKGGDRKSPQYRQAAAGPLISQRRAGTDAGMSGRQIKTAVRVANVPPEEFEAAVESDSPPTVTHLAELGTTTKPAPPGFVQATHAIGRLKEFAKFCGEHPASFVAGGIYPYERAKVRAHVSTIETWLTAFREQLQGD